MKKRETENEYRMFYEQLNKNLSLLYFDDRIKCVEFNRTKNNEASYNRERANYLLENRFMNVDALPEIQPKIYMILP